jgi:hypothetical protein
VIGHHIPVAICTEILVIYKDPWMEWGNRNKTFTTQKDRQFLSVVSEQDHWTVKNRLDLSAPLNLAERS